jgi:RNA polymerase sigma-70 factor (ECF subfamily)
VIAVLAWEGLLASVEADESSGARPIADAAWDEIVARHDRKVVLSLLARGVRLDRAREIAQETWARLIEQHRAGKLARLELPGIAITQAAFFAREDARRKEPARLEDQALLSIVDEAPSAEATLVARQRLERAKAELDRCSPTARRVFEAIYEDTDAPHAEVAKKFGLSVQRLRQTLCEVRGRLRRAMEDTDG